MIERTLILIKPDGVSRGKIGEILSRFESCGLKIVAAKMIRADDTIANKHYPVDRKELWKGIGNKILDSYRESGIDPIEKHKTDDPLKLGEMVQVSLREYITSGPVFAAVIEGPNAIAVVRKLCGHTYPVKADPGTIRGDFSFDSPEVANANGRAIRNLIHASGNKEEAEYEIKIWFKDEEIVKYKRADEEIML